MNSKKQFTKILLKWHKLHKSYFPWREATDPYKILIAELLLRKTTRNQVDRVYSKFIMKYPNLVALTSADVSELEKILRPLGIQIKRAKLLKDSADFILRNFNGKIPTKRNDLLSIPGVGFYVANAVLCFAYNKDVPLVDTNTIRVVERFFGIRSKKKRARTDPELWKTVEKLIPKSKAKKFNLAMLDFAAKICTAKNPKHEICPVNKYCVFYRNLIKRKK